ncbi:hypothetical protein MFRU_028g00090 [Monilinia fructicola]|uniref:Amino acid permease/ SLC12A domain-containing protein n=1 Tax=Monilinia fructicola TaxID=38448 RepID=A0A5M9JUI6_MONFR|nr:hypothetical protein EYC84_002906 [Monilinia fructicola]KAG4027586.1 hypothetical protein MFRU_028g00090 [Monilinia fructicola]
MNKQNGSVEMRTIGGSEMPLECSNAQDNEELTRLGKKPVLKRNFGFLSMLGFSCTVMITWEGVLLLFTINFTNGGLAGSVYGYLIVWLGTLAAFSTMAELSSMAPTAGGQYHWVSILAPHNSRKFFSYIIGWLTMVGWQAIVASGGYLSASLIQGLMVMNNASYVPQRWQLVLLYWAMIAFAITVNTLISALLPKVESVILIVHTVGFFAILVPLIYWAPHGTASDVFTLFLNEGGWSTQTLSFFVGIMGPVFSLLGADGAVHMSEEISKPSLNVPRAIVFSILLNGTLGFGMLLAALFCLGNIEEVLQTPTGYPFMAIFQQAVGSLPGALTMAAIVSLMNICATISFVATASRMTWSFARDRGVPGWQYLSKIEPRTTLPLASIALTATIAILLSLIGLGSLVAFNDVVSLSINGLYTSYLIGNGFLLYRRVTGCIQPYSPTRKTLTNTMNSELSWGPWKIPEPFGTIVNALGCAYIIVILLFSFFPITVNPTPSGMNYSCLMTGTVGIFAIVFYLLHGHKIYKGPVVEVDFE